jgi:hypothetical protein
MDYVNAKSILDCEDLENVSYTINYAKIVGNWVVLTVTNDNKYCGWVVGNPVSPLELEIEFDTWTWDMLSWQVSHGFCQFLQANSGVVH